MKSLGKNSMPDRRLMCLWFVRTGLIFQSLPVRAGDSVVKVVGLPPLRVLGQPATAHTQGLELEDGHCYVTARRDDVLPRRALLLRTAPAEADWDVWDITPASEQGNGVVLDHPGGI